MNAWYGRSPELLQNKKNMSDKTLKLFERRQIITSDSVDVPSFVSNQTAIILNTQIKVANRIIVSQNRISSGIDETTLGIDRLYDGLESLAAAFDWGFSELVWQLEQQREVLTNILERLELPLDTQAKELKKRAEKAYRNGLVDDALEDFLESEKKNRYDFTVHQYLGNIYFFEKKMIETALEYYEKAVKYATPESPYYASFALIHIALIKYIQEDFQKAYEATSKAIDISPNFYEAHFQHARYCANLGRYDETIAHLRKVIAADRYYCIKADLEKDFHVMRKQLLSLFVELRDTAQYEAERELIHAHGLVQTATSQDAHNYASDSFESTRNRLNEAEAFFRRNSYFDYLDATQKAHEVKKLALDSSIKSLSNQINETDRIYREESEEDRRKKSSIANWNFWVSLAILILIWVVSKQFWIGLIIGVVVFCFIKDYTDTSFKYKEKYEKSLNELRGDLSISQAKLSQLNNVGNNRFGN